MNRNDQELRAALGAVRDELLRQAHADADRARAEAEATAAARMAEAERTAAAMIERARGSGLADAERARTMAHARAARAARARMLAAQRDIHAELRRRVLAGTRELRDRPEYPEWRRGLWSRAAAALGADAEITESAAGGVVASAAGKRLDLSLDAAAEHVLSRPDLEVQRLWTP